MTDFKKNASVFLLFVLAALLFTFPLVLHVDSALRGNDIDALGDPLFNTWVIGQNVDKIAHLNFKGFFNGNIFYPQTRTVLYSEHLLPQSLMALPVLLVTGNPILAYNLIFLLGFILSGFGMFCLARHLTKNAPAGIVAGLIYAFSPFMLAHTFHIQILSAWGIPFAFLYLHKFFENGRLKDILFFTFFYVFQAMSNGYYALYLTFFAGAWILTLTITRKKYKDLRWLSRLALFAVLSASAMGPLFMLYARSHAEMAFSRSIDFFANLTSFLSVPRINMLYGRILGRFFRPEGELFPGIAALSLGVIGIFLLVRARRIPVPSGDRTKRLVFLVRRVLNILIVFASVIVVFIIGQDGLDLHISGVRIFRAHNLERSLIQLGVLVIARILLDLVFGLKRPAAKDPEEKILGGYSATLVLAFLFTFGPKGPYDFLYKYVPGFQAIRVASRFQILVMFALAVLAAFGLRTLIRRFKKPAAGTAIAVLAAVLVGIEFLSIPVPYLRIPLRDEMPESYKWLAANRKPGILIEMPLPSYNKGSASMEGLRMYYSLFHRNTLVNGYSGYFPPLHTELCRRQEFHDFEQLIDDFQALTIDYVLIHFDEMMEELKPGWLAKLKHLREDIRLIQQDGDDYLFEMIHRPSVSGQVRSLEGYKKLPRIGWSVKASVNDSYAPRLLDGDPKTRWESGPQNPGDVLEVDMKKPQTIRCVSLTFGPSCLDFPRGYKMEISLDGKQWTEVAREDPTVVPILAFAKPNETALNIFLPAQPARHIRITDLGKESVYYWSIHELDIYE
jgi:hypothetical protein